MEPDEALRSILEDLTIALSEDGELRDVEFIEGDEMGDDGVLFGATQHNAEKVALNPNHAEGLNAEDYLSEEQEFALIVNTESHELEHVMVSAYDPEDFYEQYPNQKKFAWYVRNLVEDTYIDKRRTDRDRGLKPIQALFSDLIFRDEDPITEYEGRQKYASAIRQIAMGGSVKDIHEVDDTDFRRYCAKVLHLIDDARNTPLASKRTELAHDIMDVFQDHVGEVEVPDVELPPHMQPAEGDGGAPQPSPIQQEPEDDEQDGAEGMDMGDMDDDMDIDFGGDGNQQQDGEGDGDGEAGDGEQDGEADGDQDSENGAGSQQNGSPTQQDPNGSGGAGGQQEPPECPQCGCEDTEELVQTVDGMVAARVNAPFNVDADWVGEVAFISNDELCGFRVRPQGDVPTAKIENNGYKVVEVNQGIEVLEPVQRYDDKEDVVGYNCPDCDHEWVPTIGGVNA